MEPHQERVLAEKKELDEKIQRLQVFVLSEKFQSLPQAERGRLHRQLGIMLMYSDVLAERIATFKK